MYITLPDGAAERTAVFNLLRQFTRDNNISVDASILTDQGDRYVAIPIPEWK
jgi:hypothetical protein